MRMSAGIAAEAAQYNRASRPMSPLSGAHIGPYEIVSPLGAGGMGEVYRAYDPRLRRHVAIKVLSAANANDPAARARLLREARLASGLNHPNVCTIHEVAESDQTYIVMELVAGTSLRDRIAEGPLPVRLVLRCGIEIADALAHAHRNGIVHRDLKSANVMLTPEGRVKVLDFGLAKQLVHASSESVTQSRQDVTELGTIAGTLACMAPEQLRGEAADARSDVWALGVLLYEMAAGGPPFKGRTAYEVSGAILAGTLAPLPATVPESLRTVVERCLEKDPGRRYQNGGEVAAALEAAGRHLHDRRVPRIKTWNAHRLAVAAAAVLVLATGAAVLSGLPWRPGHGAPSIRSVAVLPLENRSGDPQQEYFADGITDAITTNLSKIRSLTVVSRTSAMRYKATTKSTRDIAAELGVDAIVEGSVVRVGDRMRVTAQLVDAATDRALWADNYDRSVRDALTVEGEVARSIAGAVGAVMTPTETQLLAARSRVDPGAYEAYLQGRFYYYKMTPADLATARTYFELAVRKDPGYARAYVGLANAIATPAHIGLMPPSAPFAQARELTLKALAMDDTLPEAHDLLARLKYAYDWDWTGAEAGFRRAIALDPNYADVHFVYGELLQSLRRYEEALTESARAVDLDPHNTMFRRQVAHVLLALGRRDEAIALFQTLEDHAGLWDAFYLTGQYDRALDEARRAMMGEVGAAVAAHVGEGYAAAMRQAAATRASRAANTYVSPVSMARLQMHAGDIDAALESLEHACDARDTRLVYVLGDPLYQSLREHPRFQAILRRMNVPR
jgi:serine/threonine-protein kinase